LRRQDIHAQAQSVIDYVDDENKSPLERYERETGNKVSDEVPDTEDETMVALFLILVGYPPDDELEGKRRGSFPR
jgi:hypothetical protein